MEKRAALIRFVLTVKLDPSSDPREQLRRATCDLAAGTVVKVEVNGVSAIPFAVPFLNHADLAWYRTDLVWQFETNNPNVMSDWQQLVAEIQAAIK